MSMVLVLWVKVKGRVGRDLLTAAEHRQGHSMIVIRGFIRHIQKPVNLVRETLNWGFWVRHTA